MPDTTTLSRGIPVAVGTIPRELSKLWREGGDVSTRASLVNFVIWCRGEKALDANTDLVAEFVQSHACRAIVLAGADTPALPPPRVSAWIGAHCHVSRAGAKQICCEQLTFLVEGGGPAILQNLILSHLDSDLPLFLFLQEPLPENPDPQFWSWVDRLFFDSATWPDFAASARRFADLAEQFRLLPADLNWTRLAPLRLAIVRMFDPPIHQAALPKIERLEISHAPGRRSTALLLAGWIATRLGWPSPLASPGGPVAGNVRIALSETPGAAVSRCALIGPRFEFALAPDPGEGLVHATARVVAAAPHAEALPGLADRPLDLLDEELTHGRRHLPYSRALAWAASDDLGLGT